MKTIPKPHFQITALINIIFLFAGVLMTHIASGQTAAGKVVFAQGQPQAVTPQGVSRPLARGNEIFSGDKLITASGRLQISMVDGAFISVQPESEYQVETYNYSGTPDGTEIANYRLDKGGVRAITGLIGRQNPEAYKVNTAVATIGIRGTGHNTRICQGDCGNRPDGLYHNTWEGTTYVVNDVDNQDVPAGNGVYVEDIESEILFTDQPSAVVAVETTKEQREEEEEKAEEQTRVVSTGEQRDQTGDQQIVIAARVPEPQPEPEPEPEPEPAPVISSSVIPNIGILGVVRDLDNPADVDRFGFDFGSSLFIRDSDNKGIAFFGIQQENDGPEVVLATVDPAAVRAGNIGPITNAAIALLDQVSAQLLTTFSANPATVAEYVSLDGEFGYGRWTNGNILVVHDGEVAEIETLSGFQSVHWLFGMDFQSPLPVSSVAKYEFVGGTQSTSVSGATIGQGVLNGLFTARLATGRASLEMNVNHNSQLYDVRGQLIFNPNDNSYSSIIGGINRVNASGGLCAPNPCAAFIDAGYAGPAMGAYPKYLALQYDIHTADIIIGVAAFSLESTLTTTVLSDKVFVAVGPDMLEPDQVNVTFGFDTSLFIQDGKVYGVLFTEDDDGNVLRVFAGPDIQSVQPAGDDPVAVNEVFSLIQIANPTAIGTFVNSTGKATIAEGVVNPDGFGWGRWTNGSIIVMDDTGSSSTEIETLTGNQSIHFVFGTDPGTYNPTGGANYEFVGGTRSTSASGTTIGNGIIDGHIFVDFGSSEASIDMLVDHIPGFPYEVAGRLLVNGSGGGFSIQDASVYASTLAPGSACNSMCPTFIDGGFTGPSSPGLPDFPDNLGIEYDIQDADVIMGVGGFKVDPDSFNPDPCLFCG